MGKTKKWWINFESSDVYTVSAEVRERVLHVRPSVGQTTLIATERIAVPHMSSVPAFIRCIS